MKTRYDAILFLSVILLLGVGIVMVYSTSSYYALIRFGDASYFLKREMCFALMGLFAMGGLMVLDYRLLRSMVYPILLGTVILLILVFVPGIGSEAGGARRWIDLRLFTVQPSEVAKLGLVIYLAHSLIKKGERLKEFYKGFLPHIIVSGVVISLVILQPDFGTAMAMGAIVLTVLFVAGTKGLHILSALLVMAPLACLAVMGAEYRRQRILAFLNPWEDPERSGFQIIQSYLALGNGGLWGVGLGKSSQKLFYLPQAHTDFILSVIGEELGLIGLFTIVVLFAVFLARGIRVSLRAKDGFGTYLGLGLTLIISLQALIHMGVVMGLLPTKGLTLPFISYGGTSLVISLMAAGILLNISTSVEER